MDGLSQLLHKTTYIVASPILNIGKAMIHALIELLVWNLLACYRIRIEIIVDVKSVDIVSAHDIGCHTTSIVGCLLQTGVEQHQIIIRETELWMLHHTLLEASCPIGVPPCLAR